MATIAAEGENAGTPSWAPRLRASSPWSPDESLQDEGARLLSQRKKEAPAVLQWSRFWRSDRWRFAARIVLYVCVCVLVFVLFHLLFGTPWTNTTPQRFGHSLDTSRHGGAPAQAGKDPADRPRIFSLDSNGQAWANGTAFFQGVKTDYMGINIRIDAVLHAISPCLTDDIRTQTLMDMQRDLVKGGAEDVTVSGKTTPLEWTGESQRGSRITTVKAVLVYLTVLQCRFGYAKWLTTAGQEVGLADAIREEREPMKKMFEFVVRIALGGGLNEESKGLTPQRVTVSDIKWRRTTVLVSDIEGSYHYFCLWIAITPGVSLKNSACLDSKNERDMRSCCLEKVPASNCGLGDATTCAKFPILELDRGTKLVNLGDNCDQGPGCIRVQLSFLRAVSDYRDRVLLVLGNRDTHHLKIMSEAGSWRELSEFYQQRGAYGLGVPQGEGANIETVVKWSLTLSNQLGGQYALPSEAWESRRQELGILLGEDDGHEITDAATAASFVILVAPDKADTKPDERSDYMHASCSSSAPPAGGVTSDGVHPAAGAGPGSGRSWALRLEHVDVVGGDVEKGGREVRFGDLRENECKLLQGLQGIAFRLCESGKLADVDVDDAGALYTHAGPFGSPSASPPVEAYRSVHMQKLAEATGDDLISVIGYVPPALDYMPFWTQSPDERLATFKANMEDRLTGHQAKQERGVGSLKKWVADLDSWKAEQLRAYRQCPFFYSSSNTDSATNQGGTPGVENEGHARGRCVAPKMFQSTGETSDTTFVPQGGASTGAVVSLMRGRVEQGPKGLRGWTGEVAEQDRWFYQRGGIDLMLLCTPVTRYPTPCYQNHESTTKRERWVAPACRVAAETDGQVTIFARGHTPIGVAPVLLTETCTTEDMKSKQYSVVHMEIDTSYSGMMLTGDTMPTTSGHRAATASRSLFDPEERLHQDRTDKRGVGMGATVMILPLFSQDSARKGGAQLEPEDRIWVHGFAWLPRRVNPKDVHLVDWVWRESSTDESEGPSYFQVFQYGYHGSINRCPESTSTRSSQHSANGCFTSGASTVLQELSKGTQSTAAIVIPGEAIWTGMPSSLLLTLCGELFAPERASSGEVESEASQSQTPASLRGENALDRCGGPLWQEKQDDTHAATLSGDSLGAVVRRSSDHSYALRYDWWV